MPIGSSKVGVLGAGLVPGGSVTFNASGTWDVPPGVKKVSITGKGGTGNPGVAGNPGNPGNPGEGGSGGGGGRTQVYCPNCANPRQATGGEAGGAWKIAALNGIPTVYPAGPWFPPGAGQAPTYFLAGGKGGAQCSPNSASNPGQAGASGNAGSAGQAGTAGNTGQTSSGLTKCFPGGAGGNAPPGGAAGNAGTGGQAGNGGNQISAGSAGNGAGAGGSGLQVPWPTTPFDQFGNPNPAQRSVRGANGGGGAGAVNPGQNGNNAKLYNAPRPSPVFNPCNFFAQGGSDPQISANAAMLANCTSFNNATNQPYANITGGVGRGWDPSTSVFGGTPALFGATFPRNNPFPGFRNSFTQFNPACLRPTLFRSGGGGGGGGCMQSQTYGVRCGSRSWGGGGGGGGRGNAGNAGGPSPTVSGQAATPATFNCVPVTPGTPTPITVGAPGGQIVISWNPQ